MRVEPVRNNQSPVEAIGSLPLIPFNRPGLVGAEIQGILGAIDTCELSGDGRITKQCHQFLEQALAIPKALLTTSCTHALEMCALLMRLQPGDEVIVPAFTFVSTANAFVLHGAKIVFGDIRRDTLNLDETTLASLITPRTRAIVVVHYAGVGCEMDAIMRLAEAHGIMVIEDNAHGLFGKYKDRYLGTFGAFATQSFHETKNFTCGEGGALLINDPSFIERAEIIREKGTDRSKFYRGQIDKYSWRDVGSSYVPSGILAAFLLAQLSARETIQSARQRIFEHYEESLGAWAREQSVTLPTVPDHCDQAYHMFYILLPDEEARARFIAHMKAAGITTPFHYVPLNTSTMGQTLGGLAGQCPVTEDVSGRLVRLPFYNSLTRADQDRVIDNALEFQA